MFKNSMVRKLLPSLVLLVLLGGPSLGQSLQPNADSEAVFQRTIASLNKGTITALDAHLIFMKLVQGFEMPSVNGVSIYGAHAWKLSVQAQSAYFHRLTEASTAALLEAALGREAGASAWAQQLKYANIHKDAKRKLQDAMR